MLTRICWIAVTTAGVVLAAIGLVVAPFAVLTAGLVAVLVGALAAMHVYGTRKQDVGIDGKRGSHIGAVRVGLALTLATMAASMVAVGLTFLLGVGAVVVIAVLLAVVGIAGWRRRRAGRDAIRVLVTVPRYADRAAQRVPTRAGDLASGAPAPALIPPGGSEALATAQLCRAWQRSYWQLHDLPPGPDRSHVAALRHSLLDELERRDPDGFARWLDTVPRASSDPSRFLRRDR
jgi:hypothetical protein